MKASLDRHSRIILHHLGAGEQTRQPFDAVVSKPMPLQIIVDDAERAIAVADTEEFDKLHFCKVMRKKAGMIDVKFSSREFVTPDIDNFETDLWIVLAVASGIVNDRWVSVYAKKLKFNILLPSPLSHFYKNVTPSTAQVNNRDFFSVIFRDQSSKALYTNVISSELSIDVVKLL